MLKHYLDRYKTQEMCDSVVDACLPALKFLLDGFVSKKMLEKLDDVLVSNDDAIFVNTTFLVIRWVLILHILMMLTLMIIILMKMILILLFTLAEQTNLLKFLAKEWIQY